MKKLISYCLTLCILTGLISISFAEEEKKEFEPYINGFEDETFKPEKNITVAESTSIFAELLGEEKRVSPSFSDINENDWYYNSASILSGNGFFKNYSDKLNGESYITRKGLCEFVYMLKNGADNASDSDDMFSALVKDGTVHGYDDGTYGENKFITRAEAVTLINRALGFNADSALISGLNKSAFKDVDNTHWAYYDIIFAAKTSRKYVSYPNKIPEDYAGKVYDTFNERQSEWEAVPMINDNLRAKGVTIGGEGCQRMNAIAISKDGTFLMAGNDISTIYRSLNGGKSWEKCSRGFYPSGGEAFAIDPNNADRVLAFGGNHNKVADVFGIYLSEDRGFSWKQVVSQSMGSGQLELHESLCFDESSYSEEIGGSAVAYWSKNYWLYPPYGTYATEEEIPSYLKEGEHKGLWKTEDGGKTWFVVNEEMSDSIVKVNPISGVVYISNLHGFFRSEDGGKTFEHILSGSIIYGMDVVDSEPNNVYINDYKGVLVSHDSGKSFTRIEAKNFPQSVDKTNPYKSVVNLKVSPVNTKKMVIAYYEGFGVYKCKKFFSNDGGVNWTESTEVSDKSFIISNNREAMFVWSPVEEDKVWSFGGDYIVSSTDGGKTYQWDYEGGNSFHIDQRCMFNIYNPDILYFGSQDFHGAMTVDGGKNWKKIWKFADSEWSGYVYGSYAADENTLFAFKATGWASDTYIVVSRDGGETWLNTGIKRESGLQRAKWSEIGYQSPSNPNVIFMGEFRSDDLGYTWTRNQVDAVCAHNPYGKKELYGVKNQFIMVSYDDGLTWEKYCEVKISEGLEETPEKTVIWDIAYDGINNIMYYVSGNTGTGTDFCKFQNGETTDLTGNLSRSEKGGSFQLCAVDPRYSDVVYVGGYANSFVNGSGVMRSCDGGKTFQVLSTVDNDMTVVKTGPAGGIEPSDIFVHPTNGYLYVAQGCSGIVKIAPPYDN